jgi:hypothetical protein
MVRALLLAAVALLGARTGTHVAMQVVRRARPSLQAWPWRHRSAATGSRRTTGHRLAVAERPRQESRRDGILKVAALEIVEWYQPAGWLAQATGNSPYEWAGNIGRDRITIHVNPHEPISTVHWREVHDRRHETDDDCWHSRDRTIAAVPDKRLRPANPTSRTIEWTNSEGIWPDEFCLRRPIRGHHWSCTRQRAAG